MLEPKAEGRDLKNRSHSARMNLETAFLGAPSPDGADFAITLQLPGESVAVHPPNHKTVSKSAQSTEVIFSVVL